MRKDWQALCVQPTCLQVAQHEAPHRPPVHAAPQHAQVAAKGGVLGGQPAGRGAAQPGQVDLLKQAAVGEVKKPRQGSHAVGTI